MREILFRGKTYEGKWLYGSLNRFTGDDDYIQYEDGEDMIGSAVDRTTVGQYSGLEDKNGTKIFDGDIVRLFDHYIRLVGYSDICSRFVLMRHFLSGFEKLSDLGDFESKNIEILGNIYDNPELL